MKVFDFRTSLYFPGLFLFAGVLFLAAAVFLMSMASILSLIPLILSAIIFTTHYRLRIDLGRKKYFDYLWILGYKRGEWGTFENIEYVYIKKTKVSQNMHSRGSSATIRSEVYDGYLKFSEATRIHLMTRSSKKKLMHHLTPIASALSVKMVDYTEE